MLLRFAKIAGGLRLVITEAGPLVATSVALLSARSVAYIAGFALGSIVSSWLPIVALLVSITGVFGSGSSNTAECEAYRAQMRAIDEANRAAVASWLAVNKTYIEGPYKSYLAAVQAMALSASQQARSACSAIPTTGTCTVCGGGGIQGITCVSGPCNPQANCEGQKFKEFNLAVPVPPAPPAPAIQTYPACSSPNCPPGKKVWTQVMWASPGGNASDPKGCFIIAFSQDAPTLAPKVEYNPFLPDAFVKTRPISYYLVNGDRYRGLQDNDWKNLETVQGWDKGYWRSEVVDPECRGWRPGWSKPVK
jgi:hypothetical protein